VNPRGPASARLAAILAGYHVCMVCIAVRHGGGPHTVRNISHQKRSSIAFYCLISAQRSPEAKSRPSVLSGDKKGEQEAHKFA
jgi:hypothetical protein